MKESGKGKNEGGVEGHKKKRGPGKEPGAGPDSLDDNLCPHCRKILHEKLAELKHCYELCLEERKKLEKAKWVLVKKKRLDEEDAHGFLVATARQQRKKLVEIAESVITGEKFLDEEENINLLNKIISERKSGKG